MAVGRLGQKTGDVVRYLWDHCFRIVLWLQSELCLGTGSKVHMGLLEREHWSSEDLLIGGVYVTLSICSYRMFCITSVDYVVALYRFAMTPTRPKGLLSLELLGALEDSRLVIDYLLCSAVHTNV